MVELWNGAKTQRIDQTSTESNVIATTNREMPGRCPIADLPDELPPEAGNMLHLLHHPPDSGRARSPRQMDPEDLGWRCDVGPDLQRDYKQVEFHLFYRRHYRFCCRI
jgi:hypothetical protein